MTERTARQAVDHQLPFSPQAALQRIGTHPRFEVVLRHGSLVLELYAPRGTDTQQPHTRDEVYVVVSGQGRFDNGGIVSAFTTGDALFVPAHQPHRFISFSDDFAVWVMFYGPEGGEATATD